MLNVMCNIFINDFEKLLEMFIYIIKYLNLVKMFEIKLVFSWII